ncbi:GDSL-type esterase/lipase family protein [Serratia marcescens]|uniref:GDSL-type esterase/lipase family protein n=1 Tax=Serratia marcescens TaxID=615 RepID=UPI003204EB1B
MSNNGLPVTDVVGVSVSIGQRRTAGASSGDAYAQAAQNSAVNAAGSAAHAEQSELSSVENAANAKASEISAVESALSAKVDAEIAQSVAGAYQSKAAAQDAIDKGTETRKDFIVWGVIDGDIWSERYQNIDGVATPTGVTIKNGKFIDALVAVINNLNYLLPSYNQSPNLVALFADRKGRVPAWIRLGNFGFAGIESESAQRVLNASYSFFPIQMSANLWAFGVDTKGKVPMWFRNGAWGAAAVEPDTADRVINSARAFKSFNMSPNKVALYVDTKGKVPVRLINGALDVADVTPRTANIVGDLIGATGNVVVRSTSGSTLHSMRIKKAKLKTGVNARAVGLMVGDSWSEFYNFSQALANRMFADFGPRAGAGWLQLNTDPASRWENMVVTRIGWTEYDASSSNAQPPYGCGIDGLAYYTSANNATASISNVRDATGTVFYYDGNGTFAIGVGSTTKTVVGTGSGEYRSTSIPGLTSGLDTVTITTTGNTGVVCLHGFIFESELNSGCMIHKCGNGGTWAGQHESFITPRVKYFAQKLNPDFIVVNLGTNDFLQDRTTATYITALNGIIDAWRAMLPEVGIILISPPVPNATGTTPMVDFRNAMRNVARDKNVEWYDLYGDMPKNWAVGNAMGWWKDSYHPNDVGAEQIVNTLFELLLNK